MADIFISYARSDREKIEKLATALEAHGFSVWWDRNIHGGEEFSKEIEQQLEAAKVAIVAWSAESIHSEWVRDEAAQAREDGKLVPVCLDDTRPPMGFRQRQAIDLKDWKGDTAKPAFTELVDSINALASLSPVAKAPTPKPSTFQFDARTQRIALIAAIVLVIGGAAFFFLRGGSSVEGPAEDVETETIDYVTDRIAIGGFNLIGDEPMLKSLADRVVVNLSTNLTQRGFDITTEVEGVEQAKKPEFELRGVIENDEERVRVHLELVRLANNVSLWSDTFEDVLEDASAIPDRISAKTIEVMWCGFDYRSGDKSITDNLFRLFLRYCSANSSWESVQNIEAYSEEILNAAPDNANALALHAQTMMNRGFSRITKEMYQARVNEARSLAERALEIDPENARAKMALVSTLKESNTWAEYERGLKPLIGSGRTGTYASFSYASMLRMVGRREEAAEYFEKIIAVDPLNPVVRLQLAWLYSMDGRIDAAKGMLEQSKRYAPSNLDMVYYRDFQIDFFYGDPEAALEKLNNPSESHVFFPAPVVACFTAYAQARMTSDGNADEIFDACGQGRDPVAIVRFLSALGDVDRAYAVAEQISPEEYGVTVSFFLPEWEAMYRDPRFMPFAEKFGLVDYWLETDEWPDFCHENGFPYDCKEAANKARGAARE